MILLFYLCNPPFVGYFYSIPTEGSYLVVNKNLVEAGRARVVILVTGSGRVGRARPDHPRPVAIARQEDPVTNDATQTGGLTRRELIKTATGRSRRRPRPVTRTLGFPPPPRT